MTRAADTDCSIVGTKPARNQCSSKIRPARRGYLLTDSRPLDSFTQTTLRWDGQDLGVAEAERTEANPASLHYLRDQIF